MNENSIVDADAWIRDLRLAVTYGARAGLLRSTSVLDALKSAEEASSAGQSPDAHALTVAMNEVTQAIAPMTMADLKFGRDPFDPINQNRARRLQLLLTLFALGVLVFIGYFMHSLHREQSAISTLKEIQQLHPLEKLNVLRKMAQWENPVTTPNTLYDQYYQKVSELRQIKEHIENSYQQAVSAVNIPLFPLEDVFSARPANAASVSDAAGNAVPTTAGKVEPAAELALKSGTECDTSAPTDISCQKPATEICGVDRDGNMQLGQESSSYPTWMKRVLSDALNDFCFQLKVLSPSGDGALLNQNFSAFTFLMPLTDKVSLRVDWFLPFFYGLLGAAVFVMRNVASIRTPAMEWFPIVMRISLGGVAGIVIGWFSAAATTSTGSINSASLSLPFAMAFLTGYGIDVLFTVLDRLNRAIGAASGQNRPG
jgi:hypothetical protein